jgi:N utilization substance protein A
MGVMSDELVRMIDAIHRDKAIDKELIFKGLEAAIAAAAKKRLRTEELPTVVIDRKNGNIRAFDGNQEISPTMLGRIAAQSAKQVMIQKIREAERDAVVVEFEHKVGDILTGSVLRMEGPHIVVNLGKIEAIMPKSEQIHTESYRVGDRVRALLYEVKRKGQKVRLVLSRAQGEFVKRLFQIEVPEIAEGIIEIKAIAREAGSRTSKNLRAKRSIS